MRHLASTEQYERWCQMYPNVNTKEWCDEFQFHALQEFRYDGTQLT